MSQDLDAGIDQYGSRGGGLPCGNCSLEEQCARPDHQVPASTDEILDVPEKVHFTSGGTNPQKRAIKSILVWIMFQFLFIGAIVAAAFCLLFPALEHEKQNGTITNLGGIHIPEPFSKSSTPEPLAPPLEIQQEKQNVGEIPEAPITPDTPGVERQYITKSGLILEGYALQGGSEFEDPESYNSRALEILLNYGILVLGKNDSLNFEKLAQRYALLCLFFSTSGNQTSDATDSAQESSWKTPWGSPWDSDECDWPGVICSENKLVQRLDLGGNLLVGELPMELIILNQVNITAMDFSNNPRLGKGGFPAMLSEFDSLSKWNLKNRFGFL